jgi:uncharacterized protein YbjT (DUF2867 family)
MYAITGISGQVGHHLARALMQDGRPVRAVLRDPAKGRALEAQGCDVALARMDDARALARAFTGSEAAFILLPPYFDPAPGFPEARAVTRAVCEALSQARPARVVCLSTVGAQAPGENLLTQLRLLEEGVGATGIPVTFLRPAWYMENFAWDIASARATGAFESFLNPLDRTIPMVSVADVGRVAAQLLQEETRGRRVVELEGPGRVSPLDVAAALSDVLGRRVEARAVPRASWEALFASRGMKNPLPRIRMLDGFNEGWIGYEGATRRGEVTLRAALRPLADRAA